MDHVAGAREKLKRANKHVEDFKTGFTLFLRENPQRIWHDPDESGVQKTLFIRVADVPAPLVCMVGDAVHNLRSALDHLAYAVATNAAKTNASITADVLDAVNFPVRPKVCDFNGAMKDGKVTCIGPHWIDFLTRIEPYNGGKGSDLYVISRLDNLDKHRNLIVVDAVGDTFIRNEISGEMLPVERGLSFKNGIEITLDPTNAKYHTHSQTRVIIRENIPGLDPDAWANVVLERLVKSVVRVIDAAEADARLWS